MTASTASNCIHTASMDAVKLTASTASTASIEGCSGVDAVERCWTDALHPPSMNRMSQPATTHGRYDQRMTIVAGIAAIAASSLLLLAPAVVLATAQARRQADRTAAAELERRRAADVRFEFRGDVATYAKAFDDIAKAMEAERRRRTLSGEEG